MFLNAFFQQDEEMADASAGNNNQAAGGPNASNTQVKAEMLKNECAFMRFLSKKLMGLSFCLNFCS